MFRNNVSVIVSVIEDFNLEFICDLVLGIWNFIGWFSEDRHSQFNNRGFERPAGETLPCQRHQSIHHHAGQPGHIFRRENLSDIFIKKNIGFR